MSDIEDRRARLLEYVNDRYPREGAIRVTELPEWVKPSDIAALVKRGQILREVRKEYDRQRGHGANKFGGAGVCVRHRAYVMPAEPRTLVEVLAVDPYDDAIRKAGEIGTEHGTNAASWVDWGRMGTADVLQAIESGDPKIYDVMPAPDLSGQWADGYTTKQLAIDCNYSTYMEQWIASDEMVDAYETAFSTAVKAEVVRVCRLQLADIGACPTCGTQNERTDLRGYHCAPLACGLQTPAR